jgi:hypothetical protein
VRDEREPLDEPPVDLVGDVLGPVGADLVVERHLGGNDDMVRPEVHGAQVKEGGNSRRVFDLGPDQLQILRPGGAPDAASSDQK